MSKAPINYHGTRTFSSSITHPPRDLRLLVQMPSSRVIHKAVSTGALEMWQNQATAGGVPKR